MRAFVFFGCEKNRDKISFIDRKGSNNGHVNFNFGNKYD